MNESDERMLDAAVEGTLSPDLQSDFNRKLQENIEFREAYLQQVSLDALLRLRMGKEKENVHAFSKKSHRRAKIISLAAALAAVIAGVVCFRLYQEPREAPIAQNKPTAPVRSSAIDGISLGSVARVIQDVGANASGPFGKVTMGSLLRPGFYTVKSGKLALSFDSGAVVYLEGPAQIELETPFYAVLHEGQATAVVPEPATGFVIKTPTARIEDLGTSFAVSVAPSGETKMRVLQGEVKFSALQGATESRSIYAEQAVEVTASGGRVRSIGADKVPVTEPLLLENGTAAKYVHWSFDSRDKTGQFIDTGMHPDDAPYKLYFENEAGSESTLVEGQNNQGWYFDGKRCALVSNFPGIAKNSPRTVSFWVKVPNEADPKNAYSIVSWGIPSIPSRKWQIAWNVGGMPGQGTRGAIRTEFGHGFVIGSTDLRDGQWHHVTSVFLGDKVLDVAESIRHYIDGRLEAVSAYKSQKIWTETTELSKKAKILKFGQRLEQDVQSFPAFKGTIDEVYIFDGALTPEQIYELYEKGRPPEQIFPVGE